MLVGLQQLITATEKALNSVVNLVTAATAYTELLQTFKHSVPECYQGDYRRACKV